MKTLMKCGHSANAICNGEPSCAICIGIHPGAGEIEVSEINLVGRKAKCTCGRTEKSKLTLPFFEFRGIGSREAVDICKHCRYASVAHTPQVMDNNNIHLKCKTFEAVGPWETDSFYCGHAGWD